MRNLFALSLLTAAAPTFAQPLMSPEVHADGRITFRLRAPNAREVVVRCEGTEPLPMAKNERGVWSATTDPMEPDIYAYSFAVDGLRVLDPANPLLKYNLLNTDSQVHVPGPAELAWEINKVPHGVLHRHLYHSDAFDAERPFVVYTPPGYEREGKSRYPVLYLLHGYSDAEDAWTATGRAHVILDNLIARGQAKPMLVVMPLGYGNREVIENGWQGLGQPGVFADSNAKFRDILLTEIIPRVEYSYRVKSGRDARAVAGLSMGGTQSLLIGLNALDRFAWIGAFSSGGLNENFDEAYPAVDQNLNHRLTLLWIACGRDDGLMETNQKLIDWLKSKKVKPTWTESDGGHSFRVWRRYLADFLPLLFRWGPSFDREDYYFPIGMLRPSEGDGDRFVRRWYSKHLQAMKEPSLSEDGRRADHAYRFLWLRTFHHPVSVRIEQDGSSFVLHAVELDGAGGYDPGEIDRRIRKELSAADWERLTAPLNHAEFWQKWRKRSSGGTDGAEWILEGVQKGQYQVAVQWSPDSGEYREVCLRLLELTGFLTPETEVY